MENFAYLFAAYAAFWVLLFGYLRHIHRHQQRLSQEIEALEQRLEDSALMDGEVCLRADGRSQVVGV